MSYIFTLTRLINAELRMLTNALACEPTLFFSDYYFHFFLNENIHIVFVNSRYLPLHTSRHGPIHIHHIYTFSPARRVVQRSCKHFRPTGRSLYYTLL